MDLVVVGNKEITSLIGKANSVEGIAEKFPTWKSGSLAGDI